MQNEPFISSGRPTVIVVITVVESAGKLLLIEESKPDFRGQWNLPGGRLEPDESLCDAARREVLEEAGITVRLTGLLALDQRMVEPELGPDRLRVVFTAEACGGQLKQVADEHSLRAAWFDPEALARLPLRTPFVQRMVELAAMRPARLPITSVGLMTAEEQHHERRRNAMTNKPVVEADDTAVRVALWRALHVQVDPPPHIIADEIGLALAAPDAGWQERPDMSPFTRPFRASIVARARFIEDLVEEQAARGVEQYVILGAGLDTFAQRRPELASRLLVFEVDKPGPQEWKRRRLHDLGFGVPAFLRFVPVNFEAGDAWWERLAAAGFDASRPAVVASTGVSMYLTHDAIAATLRQIATFAPGSTFAMSFMLPIELADPELRPGIQRAADGARANGTPFISFFTPAEMLALAREAGLEDARHVSAVALAERYFAGRTDGLRPPSNAEELLVATT